MVSQRQIVISVFHPESRPLSLTDGISTFLVDTMAQTGSCIFGDTHSCDPSSMFLDSVKHDGLA